MTAPTPEPLMPPSEAPFRDESVVPPSEDMASAAQSSDPAAPAEPHIAAPSEAPYTPLLVK